MNYLGYRLSRNGHTFVSGKTWHPAVGLHNEHAKRDCFELEWDEGGNGTPTGQRAQMTEVECNRTQEPSWREDLVAGTRSEAVVEDGVIVEWRTSSLLHPVA